MENLDVRSITVASLPDLVSPCILAGTLGGKESLPSEAADRMTRGKLDAARRRGHLRPRRRTGGKADRQEDQ